MANETYIYRGDAVAVSQVDSILVGGTWVAADKITLTINGKSIVITVGATVTTAAIATAIKEAWNGDAITGDATRDITGDLIPEFDEVTATVNASTVTLTAGDGTTASEVPFTLSVSEDSTLGTLTHGPADTVANGPSHWTKENFYKAGDPADDLPGTLTGASVFIENTSANVLYNLDQSGVTNPWADLTIPSSFTGTIGLPKTNGGSYEEYRERYLKLPVAPGDTTVKIGEGEGSGSSKIQLDFGTGQSTISVAGSANGTEGDLKAIILKGTHGSNTLEITGGEVDIAPDKDDTSVIATLRVIGDGVFRASEGVDVSTLATFEDSAEGTLAPLAADTLATLTMTGSPNVTYGGDGPITTVNLLGGTLDYQGAGTITTLNGGPDASVDFAGNPNASVTLTNTNVEARFSLNDPDGRVTFTNPINQGNISENDWEHDFGKGRTIHPEG